MQQRQARKRRQAVKQRTHNVSLRSTCARDQESAKGDRSRRQDCRQAEFTQSMSIIDSIADKKIIHKNKAHATRAACRRHQGFNRAV